MTRRCPADSLPLDQMTRQAYPIDLNGHIHELIYTGQWKDNDLSANTKPNPAPYDSERTWAASKPRTATST